MTGRRILDVRPPAPPPERVGLAVAGGTGRAVGVVVYDSRSLHGAACRCSLSCWWLVVDHPSLPLVARDLRDHLRDVHGVGGVTLDLRGGHWDTGRLDRILRQVRAGWGTRAAA